jgi:hypothetical protein
VTLSKELARGQKTACDNIQQFLSLELSDKVKRKILRENALRIFNLGGNSQERINGNLTYAHRF